jgi:triphosphoribosyl-dephospho-CoA synthetase
MKNILRSFCNEEQIARYYAKVAVTSLYHEVALYPKPGLVSFIDSGPHHDMNGQLFFKSLLGLRHYFYLISLRSIQGKSQSELVILGRQAEDKMLATTGGVNTHKGAIFALGILCASIAKLTSQKVEFSLENLQQAIIKDWAHYLQNHHQTENSHGELMKKKYRLTGAKEMAIKGYEPVFNVFKELSSLRMTDNEFYGLLAFKALLLCVDDTNIIYRAGLEGLKFARESVIDAIFPDDKQRSMTEAIKLHKEFSKRNISPGGVADMLGMIYFLKQSFREHSQ